VRRDLILEAGKNLVFAVGKNVVLSRADNYLRGTVSLPALDAGGAAWLAGTWYAGAVQLPALAVSGRVWVMAPVRINGGRLAYLNRRAGDEATFRYDAPVGFQYGILTAEDERGNKINQVIYRGGTFTLSGLSSRRYRVWVVAYGESGHTPPIEHAAVSNVIQYEHQTGVIDPNDRMDIEWRSDYHEEWMGGVWPDTVNRARLVPNATAHWLQYRVRGQAQNQRVRIRNLQVEAGVHGMAEMARGE
jgi:hypothetical protein